MEFSDGKKSLDMKANVNLPPKFLYRLLNIW